MDASDIGRLYASARVSQAAAVHALAECGKGLADIRESLPHGAWELWVKEHQAELGFTIITARRLIQLAKRSLTTDLTEEQATEISRQVWGNEPQMAPSSPNPFSSHFRRIDGFVEWASKHPVAELPDSELIELRPRIEALRLWIAELDGKAKRLNLRIAS